MFKKIDLKFSLDHDSLYKRLYRLEKLTPDISHHEYQNLSLEESLFLSEINKTKPSKFYYKPFAFKKILNALPSSVLEIEIPSIAFQIIEDGKLLTPHTDYTRNTAINFYLKTNNERTIFYRKKRNGIVLSSLQKNILVQSGVESYNHEIFLPEWLEELDSFVAKDDEWYILNVSKIHAVESNEENNKRISITFGFNTPYNELIKFF